VSPRVTTTGGGLVDHVHTHPSQRRRRFGDDWSQPIALRDGGKAERTRNERPGSVDTNRTTSLEAIRVDVLDVGDVPTQPIPNQ
jgi:hypothetical protein